MSIATSEVSVRPASTVVGSRSLKRIDDDTDPCAVTLADDESFKREICARFERRLKISKYLRDKKNEERLDYDRFIRINSRRLRCSYQIPAADLYAFLKRLYNVLAPGLQAEQLKKTSGKKCITKDDERSLKLLHDWITCSDLTVQVFPKTPTVLWLDLECMVCKGGAKEKRRHFSSKTVIETVVRVVTEFTTTKDIAGDCDLLYVTRGVTCGMHLFFPHVTLFDEDDLLELWTSVNMRLVETGQTIATVDTGCSAMPLPLSRDHNGLTRVQIKINPTDDKEMSVQTYQLTKPSVKDMARVTNFYHLVADVLKSKNPSPPSSVMSSDSTVGSVSRVFNKRPRHNDERYLGGDTFEESCPEGSPTVKKPKLSPSENEKDAISESDSNRSRDNLCDPGSSAEEEATLLISDTVAEEGVILEESVPTEVEPKNGSGDDSDERASNVSSTSKRLVQADIRSLCAKMNLRKGKRSFIEQSPDANPFPCESIIVLDDEERTDTNREHCAVSKLARKNEEDLLDTSDADRFEQTFDDFGVETASSFLYMGYTPSVISAKTHGNSCLSTRDSEEVESSADGRVERNATVEPTVVPVCHEPSYGHDIKNRPLTSNSNDAETFQPPLMFVQNGKTTTTGGTIPREAHLPELVFRTPGSSGKRTTPINVTEVKEAFENSMTLRLDNRQNPVHETDMQLITSTFNAEVDFYVSMLQNSTTVGSDGLRIKTGCSLNDSRENCPSGLFQEYVPHVLYSEDFVSERDWIAVLVRYFDEYLNNAPFLYVMSHVLKNDENVVKNLNETTRREIQQVTNNCLLRFKNNNDSHRTRDMHYVPKQPYDEKCMVVVGLIAVCSLAFKVVTPIFTDLAKICRLLLGNSQQTSETLNSSTMPTTSNDGSYDSVPQDDQFFFDESVSQVDLKESKIAADEDDNANWERVCDLQHQQQKQKQDPSLETNVSTCVGNDHCILASILRWNYSALADQTLWCLFFYYYHVHSDGLARIMNEVVHGGLMVTAVLQAYFETFANNAPINIGLVCRQVFNLNAAFQAEDEENDKKLMPPPRRQGNRQKAKKGKYCRSGSISPDAEERKQQYQKRDPNAKKAQRRVREERSGATFPGDEEEDEEYGEDEMSTCGGKGNGRKKPNYIYRTDFDEVLSLVVRRYLRPVTFDETTVVYTEAGYEPRHNEFTSSFSSCNKELKTNVKDTFSRATLRYSMPHGDLSMYNTDVTGTVHRRSSCTNNLVLNIFENMYGGCMTYLTRRYNNNLKLFNRFNGDAYRLVVECRHATNEFIQSIELSYINLILRQPVVPPVLESDIAIREMFMSQVQIMKGAFVCLNAMDYMRCVNMFTRHSKLPQENCRTAESFLDKLIIERDALSDGDEEARICFRSAYLFFLLYIFEVLYKIRHAYNRDRTYYVSIERLSWDLDIRLLLKLFFGAREFKTPRGLSPEALKVLDIPIDTYNDCEAATFEYCKTVEENKAVASRCVNTRPIVSTVPPNKEERMIELFKKKGIVIMKSYASPRCGETSSDALEDSSNTNNSNSIVFSTKSSSAFEEHGIRRCEPGDREAGSSYEERDRAFLDMNQAKLEDLLYSSATWYENCRVRMTAVARIKEAEKKTKELEMCMDAVSIDTFLRTQLRVNIDNDRLNNIDRAVRENKDFAFCTRMPLRTKMMALVLATHSIKRMTAEVATDFLDKEYWLERSGCARFTKGRTTDGLHHDEQQGENTKSSTTEKDTRPDFHWENTWKRLLGARRSLLTYCRSLAEKHFPDSYFVGLRPDDTYNALYNYMLGKPQYTTLHALQSLPWAKDVCVAMNFLLVMNAYDTELVDLCLRMFLGFEWPGQWAKRIFVWKSNSNAGKSFFFESIISKVFDHSTSINDPKGGKDNAPEKSEYYKNFLLMINEFTTASSCELKKLCSTSGYKFRMNFGNQMIQAYMVGKMVFNCNTLPLTTDHATIQRVALIPLPFWFQKRQSVVDALLNWTRGQTPTSDYERNFRRKVSRLLTAKERQFFIDNAETKNENDLFNEPDQNALKMLNRAGSAKTGASMFLVQNKTSQVYMSSSPATGTIVSGIMLITRYFCRFRYFNKIKEPVDFATIPTACTVASQEWERFSQPYYEWKERYRVEKDTSVRTKVSVIHNSLSHFAKNYSKNTSFFDLRQFFEVDFVENKISYYNANREDEYYIRLDPPED